MDFLKIKDCWTYQLPEWDNFLKEDIEEALSEVHSLTIEEFTLSPNSDMWRVLYLEREYYIVNDLVYGCEVRAMKQEDLSTMEQLIKKMNI